MLLKYNKKGVVEINNYEVIKETKISYEYINDILENAELNISQDEQNYLKNTLVVLQKIYNYAYEHIENKESLNTTCDCPKCQSKLIISDLIDYSYLCETCDENFYFNEIENNKEWYLKSDINEKLKRDFDLEISYDSDSKKMYVGSENSSGVKYTCNDIDDIKESIEDYIYGICNYNVYTIKIWETEEDREVGESFEYLKSFIDLDEAIVEARKIISRNNYAFIEVVDEDTKELFFSTDGIDEIDYEELNEPMEIQNEL